MSICVTKSLEICTSDPYKISLFLHQMHLTAWRRRWVRSPLSSTVASTSHIRPSALAWRSAQLLWADSRGVKTSTWGPCSLAPVLRHSSIQTKVLYRQKFNCISPQIKVFVFDPLLIFAIRMVGGNRKNCFGVCIVEPSSQSPGDVWVAWPKSPNCRHGPGKTKTCNSWKQWLSMNILF